MVGLVANMYPHRSLAELGLTNKYQAFYAGKIALWCYLIPEWDINDVTVAPDLPARRGDWGKHSQCRGQNLYSGYHMDQCGRAPAHYLPRSGRQAYPVTIDGAAYRQQVFTVTSPTWVDGQAVNVSFRMGRTYRRRPYCG